MQQSRKRVKLENEQKHISDNWKQQCASLLETIFQWEHSTPFRYPVNLNEFPDYRTIIVCPMDLSTVQKKLNNNHYSSPIDFRKDMRLIFLNSRKYNISKRPRIYSMAIVLSSAFEEQMKIIVNNWKLTMINKQNTTKNQHDSKRQKPIPAQLTHVNIDASTSRGFLTAAPNIPNISRDETSRHTMNKVLNSDFTDSPKNTTNNRISNNTVGPKKTVKTEDRAILKACTHTETRPVSNLKPKVPWQDSCSSITSAFKCMLDKEIAVDAVFKKNKTSCLFAHKLILSIWSAKFADWIATTDKTQMFSIPFEEDIDVMQLILEYLYSPDDENCFSRLPLIKLIQALEISERFEIHHVHKKCLSSLHRKKINPSNVMDFFDYGLKKNYQLLIKKCVKVFENEGVDIEHIKKDFSVKTLISLLSLNKIAVNSEADLLNLAINWLCPDNKHYKHQVLASIDLQSINHTEYKDICMKYPDFFSDAELSAIILSQLRQDPKLLPSWYKPQIRTVVENQCFTCIYIHKRVKFTKPVQFLYNYNRKDLKSVSQKFVFEFRQFIQAKLLNIELNFGPHEICLREFTLQFSVNKNVPVKEYSISTSESNGNYKIFFRSPLVLKLNDSLTLKFQFQRGLSANNIHVLSLASDQLLKFDRVPGENEYNVCLSSPEVAFYFSGRFPEKFIVSSFSLNMCDDHRTFLRRESFESGNIFDITKMNPKFENHSELISTKFDIKKETACVKMETENENLDYGDDSTATVLNSYIKKEDTLNLLDETRFASFQILECDRVTNIKKEFVDIEDE